MNEPVSRADVRPDEQALRSLGRMYRFSRIRYLLLLLIPALWFLGFVLAGLSEMSSLSVGFLIGWFFVVLFGVGAWVFLLIPDKEEIRRKYVSHILPALFRRENLEINYYPSHDLSVHSLLKSGLYHDDYSTVLREDCITGTTGRMNFGMYQVAVQVVTGVSGRYGNSARIATNMFYGWVIHCIIPTVRGTHVIIPRNRKTGDESDDWLEKVKQNWWNNPKSAAYESGNAALDREFVFFTDQLQTFQSFATKEFLEFLLYLQQSATNAFAITISGNLFMMHIGHVSPSFRHCPDGDFVNDIHPEMEQDVKWFTSLLKGVQKFNLK